MEVNADFRDLIRKVREGDEQAATQLVHFYQDHVRRAIRVRFMTTKLRRTLDSTDICQSVLLNFFMKVAEGNYDLNTPDELIKLLCTMAKNKIVDKTRKARHGFPSAITEESGSRVLENIPDPREQPSQEVANRDLVQHVRSKLRPSERVLFDQRVAQRGWDDIAEEHKATPDALRKQLLRALERVAACVSVL